MLEPLSGCLPTSTLVFADVPVDQLARPSWQKDPTVQRYAGMVEVGRKKFRGPLLVLAGDIDIIVPFDSIASAVDDTCAMASKQNWDESLEMTTYQSNHFPVIQSSQRKWMQWVKDRLDAGPSPKKGCTKNAVHGLRTEFTFQSTAPNFLEGWAAPTEAWKYVL